MVQARSTVFLLGFSSCIVLLSSISFFSYEIPEVMTLAQGEFNIDKAKETHAALDDLSKQMARQLSDFRGHICEMYRVWNCENSEIILTDCLTVHLDNIGPIETGTLDGFAEYALARSADNRASEERNTQTTAAMKSLFDYT